MMTKEIESKINELEKQFENCEDFIEKMEIKQAIFDLKKEAGIIKPDYTQIECVGCGS